MWPFNNDEIINKTIDNVLDKEDGLLSKFGGWVNDLNLTDAEQLKINTKTVENVQVFVKDTLSESTERSKNRRSIAGGWIKVQLALVLFTVMAAPFSPELAAFYFDLATSNLMFGGTMAIIIFHFGSYGLARNSAAKAAK